MTRKSTPISTRLLGDKLFGAIRSDFEKIADLRQQGKVTIPLTDALMSGFAMFSLKAPSLLHFHEETKNEAVAHNLTTIYKINQLCSDTQMRTIVDPVAPEALRASFKTIFNQVEQDGGLKQFKFLGRYFLASMDGTGYFSSTNVSCPNCQTKINKTTGQISYSHAMLGIALVHPDRKEVIALAPEPIIKQDGTSKNDCERNAAKRLLEKLKTDHPDLPLIITEDALSPNAPHISELKRHDFRFILGVKEGDHKFLFSSVQEKKLAGETTKFEIEKDGVIHRFHYINSVPLNESNQDLLVNFLEYWEIKGTETKYFSWVTDIEISTTNVYWLMKGGRARWKIENETFNTLKNQGYKLEHNFGHGYKNLSVNFALLMMLAFLVDQVQEIGCQVFQAALEKKGRRIRLWNNIKAYFYTLFFDSWKMLLEAILYGIKIKGFTILYNTS